MKHTFNSVYRMLCSTSIAIALLFVIPFTSYAALAANNPAQDLLTRLSFFIKNLVIPVLFGIAFLFFLINLTRYFIIGGANEDSREKAKRNTMYGLAAFVFLVSIWGIVSLVTNGIGIDTNNTAPCSDYLRHSSNGTNCP